MCGMKLKYQHVLSYNLKMFVGLDFLIEYPMKNLNSMNVGCCGMMFWVK